MDPQEFRSKLGGVVGFPVTPFNEDLSLDIEGLRKNVAAMIQEPFTTIVAAGGTGEMYSLTQDEYVTVVKNVVEEVGGKIPVIAGTGFSRALATGMASAAEKVGASGILCFPPYYPGANFEGLLGYYKAIGEASKLGIMIYSRDWAKFSPKQVEALSNAIPTLVAWKEGQADIRTYQMIMERLGDRLYWIGGAGDDMVPSYYSLGIRTYTSSISNVAPKLSIMLHDLASKNTEDAELKQLMKDYVVPLYDFRTRRKGYEVSVMKRMMDMVGLAGGPVRPPLVDVTDSELEELQAMVDQWKPVL